jgi:hypothetical protein
MIPESSKRVRFANSLNKDLYERLQEHSKSTNIPISKILDQAVEEYFVKSKITINDDLYSYLCVYFGTKGLDIDEEIENILVKFVDGQQRLVEDIIHSVTRQQRGKRVNIEKRDAVAEEYSSYNPNEKSD